jgi:LAO/AO transport system kinase
VTKKDTATGARPSVPGGVLNESSLKYFVDGILAQNRVALAQAITLVESSRREDESLALAILDNCFPHTGKSIRVGITGVPGAGKSSVIEALGNHLINERQEKVAVLAIDPSSQISGGSILGDKTRMPTLAASEMAFIRPTPSRGSSGGVARRTRETMLLCEAAGFSNVIVETVGVGQSETTVKGMVDFFLLLMITGAGDELQGIKRGIVEMADLVAINKADGENRARAEAAKSEFKKALHSFPRSATAWTPTVMTCSALTGENIPQLWDAVLEHRARLTENGWLERIRQEQKTSWMHEEIDHRLREDFRLDSVVREKMPGIERDVAEGRTTSFTAAKKLIASYIENLRRQEPRHET